MDKKIVIGLVLAIIVAGAGAAYVALDMMTYEKKTVEIFENGTSMVVPATVELTNKTEGIVTFEDKENTTHIVGFRYDDSENFLNVNGIIESLVDQYIHNVTDKAELQDNGVFKLSGEERKKLAAQSGTNIKDKDDPKDAYIGILKNESLNQTIIIVSENEQYVVDMMESIEWKKSPKENLSDEAVAATPAEPAKTVDEETETDDDSTESDLSAETDEDDFPEDEVDDTIYEDDSDYEDESYYEDDFSDEEVTYGDEEW